MLVAEHRGIRSLSIVMVTGLAITWLACMLVLPAALRLRTRSCGHLEPEPASALERVGIEIQSGRQR